MIDYIYLINALKGRLPIEQCFDLTDRPITFGGVYGHLYYLESLTNSEKVQRILNYFMELNEEEVLKIRSSDDFVAKHFPYSSVTTTDVVDDAVKNIFSGLLAVVLSNGDKIILADVRQYPSRSVEEPDKEKSLRGAKDGFTESFMENVGLIRRRIRDSRLHIETFDIGNKTRTDVGLVYMQGISNSKLVFDVKKALNKLITDDLSVSDQSLVEKLLRDQDGGKYLGKFNPFPKVRYTQRPDIICAHVMEGKIAIIIDNSPTVILLPVGIFDFLQDVDDYYFPIITGNYLRMIRIINMIAIMTLSPIYMLIVEKHLPPPIELEFFIPETEYAIPIFWQFLLLEIAVDGLKLASLNTPSSLGMSLSVIGALILGQFSIDSGWFIPQTILVMAVVALASFTQPSIELGYSMKFIRMLLLVGCMLFGWKGGLITLFFCILNMALTKTVSGRSYLYPLYPFKYCKSS